MTGKTTATGITLTVAAIALLLTVPAHSQVGKKGSKGGAPTENRPKVDEKAYKAALDRIPTPKKPYDPWGQVHDSEQAKTSNKPN